MLLSDVAIYSRDGLFSSDIGFFTLCSTKGTHWVANINQIFLIHRLYHLLKNNLSSI